MAVSSTQLAGEHNGFGRLQRTRAANESIWLTVRCQWQWRARRELAGIVRAVRTGVLSSCGMCRPREREHSARLINAPHSMARSLAGRIMRSNLRRKLCARCCWCRAPACRLALGLVLASDTSKLPPPLGASAKLTPSWLCLLFCGAHIVYNESIFWRCCRLMLCAIPQTRKLAATGSSRAATGSVSRPSHTHCFRAICVARNGVDVGRSVGCRTVAAVWCNTTCVWQRLRHVCRRCRCLILSQSKSLTRSSARPLECPLRRRLAFWQAFFLGKSSRNRQAKMVADARVAQVYSAAAAACKRSRQTDRRTDERATSARTHKALISSRRRASERD